MYKALLLRLRERLWEHEGDTRYERQKNRLGRYTVVLARDLLDGQISMRAMSLVYTTLLSIVPLLALAFSLFKALGVHNMLEPVLLRFLQPLGPKSAEIAQNVIGFVENIKVGVLGFVGIALLFYTALSLIQKVESSFNFIWRIERVRPLSQRVGEYLSVLMVGPMLVFLTLGTTAMVLNSAIIARLTEVQPLGLAVYMIGRLIPYLLIIAAFTFFYVFVPNTRVRMKAAAAGGVFAGVLWQTASVAFASFVTAATNYSAIYSGFAIVILLLIWFYIGWLILLLGCQLAFYVQHPEHLTPTRIAPYLSGRSAEALGLAIVGLTGKRFIDGQPPLTEEEIMRTVNAPPEHVARVIEVLLHHGVLAESATDAKPSLLPGRDLEGVTIGEIWQMLRRGFDGTPKGRTRDDLIRSVAGLLDEAEQHFLTKAGARSVRQWILESEARS